MAKLTTSEVRQAAKEIILRNPQGIRYGEIVKQLVAMHPETNRNMIETQVCCLDVNLPSEILKPSRGLYKPAGLHGTEQGQTAQAVGKPTGVRVTEEEFYAPFAQYLKTNLGEVTVAMSLGGAAMKGKWGTPDVIGAYKPLASHRIKFDIEIVSAEIKIDPQAPVVAFGQAIAYRLFSTKVYAVMPNTLAEEDNRRLYGLCLLFGIGLVFFTPDKTAPGFAIRVRAQRFSPDMLYVNDFAERLYQHSRATFDQLFG